MKQCVRPPPRLTACVCVQCIVQENSNASNMIDNTINMSCTHKRALKKWSNGFCNRANSALKQDPSIDLLIRFSCLFSVEAFSEDFIVASFKKSVAL